MLPIAGTASPANRSRANPRAMQASFDPTRARTTASGRFATESETYRKRRRDSARIARKAPTDEHVPPGGIGTRQPPLERFFPEPSSAGSTDGEGVGTNVATPLQASR